MSANAFSSRSRLPRYPRSRALATAAQSFGPSLLAGLRKTVDFSSSSSEDAFRSAGRVLHWMRLDPEVVPAARWALASAKRSAGGPISEGLSGLVGTVLGAVLASRHGLPGSEIVQQAATMGFWSMVGMASVVAGGTALRSTVIDYLYERHRGRGSPINAESSHRLPESFADLWVDTHLALVQPERAAERSALVEDLRTEVAQVIGHRSLHVQCEVSFDRLLMHLTVKMMNPYDQPDRGLLRDFDRRLRTILWRHHIPQVRIQYHFQDLTKSS